MSLRDQHKRMTHELLLRAAADEIVERGLASLSLSAVAKRAGVAEKTLYNHFESRDALLSGLHRWSDELLAADGVLTTVPFDLDALAGSLGPTWAAWERQGRLFEARIQLWAAEGRVAGDRSGAGDPHATAVAAMLRGHDPALPDDVTAALVGVIRALLSPDVWNRFRTRYGIPTHDSAQAVTWTIRVLHEALARGDRPGASGADAPDSARGVRSRP